MEGVISEKQIKKKIANEKYRAKLKDSASERDKQDKQDITSTRSSQNSLGNGETQDIAISESGNDGDSENEETFVLDKKSYLYLLEKARSNEKSKEETPKETPKEAKVETKVDTPKQNEEPSFFFLIKNQFKTTAISLLPILTIQMTMLGAKYIMASQPNSILMKSTTNTQNQQKQQHQQYTQEFVLPQVNSL